MDPLALDSLPLKLAVLPEAQELAPSDSEASEFPLSEALAPELELLSLPESLSLSDELASKELKVLRELESESLLELLAEYDADPDEDDDLLLHPCLTIVGQLSSSTMSESPSHGKSLSFGKLAANEKYQRIIMTE